MHACVNLFQEMQDFYTDYLKTGDFRWNRMAFLAQKQGISEAKLTRSLVDGADIPACFHPKSASSCCIASAKLGFWGLHLHLLRSM